MSIPHSAEEAIRQALEECHEIMRREGSMFPTPLEDLHRIIFPDLFKMKVGSQ